MLEKRKISCKKKSKDLQVYELLFNLAEIYGKMRKMFSDKIIHGTVFL